MALPPSDKRLSVIERSRAVWSEPEIIPDTVNIRRADRAVRRGKTVTSTPNHVLITGATSGIGAAVAKRFITAGFKVIAWDINAPTDFECEWSHVDVSDSESVKSAATNLPPLYAVVTCAGIGTRGSLVDLGYESFQRVISINLKGTANTAIAVFDALAQGKGTLITIGSITAINGFHHRAGYSASKAAVVALTRCLGNEWAEYGIRAICVSPGFVNSPMALEGIKNGLTNYDGIIKHTAMKTLIEPEALADSIYALTGPDFRRATGVNILIDAGWDSLSGVL